MSDSKSERRSIAIGNAWAGSGAFPRPPAPGVGVAQAAVLRATALFVVHPPRGQLPPGGEP